MVRCSLTRFVHSSAPIESAPRTNTAMGTDPFLPETRPYVRERTPRNT